MTRKAKTIWIVVIVVVAVVLVGFGVWFFEPQALVIDKTVDEAPPTASASPTGGTGTPTTKPVPQVGNVILASGPFRSYEHTTTGKASMIRLSNGQSVVRLTDFETSNGPDVRVWLSQAPASAGDAANDQPYVDLGALKGNIGNQNYEVPESAANQKWESVYIWCRRFTVAFGAAPLTPAPLTPRQ